MIPNMFQVGKNLWCEVLWTDEFKDEQTLGESRLHSKQVIINKNQSPKETFKTYIHEVLHFFSDTYGWGLTENQIRKIEESIYYWIKEDNILKKRNGKK